MVVKISCNPAPLVFLRNDESPQQAQAERE